MSAAGPGAHGLEMRAQAFQHGAVDVELGQEGHARSPVASL